MGYEKDKRPSWSPGETDKVTKVSSTASLLPGWGVVTFSTASDLGAKVYRLPPPKPGARLTIINPTPGSSKSTVVIRAGASTTANFQGSTDGTITFTSGKKRGYVDLVGASTAKWCIISDSTGATVAG